ncbi:DUF6350 family protein [Bifidobacterium margollesii]|uniref:cell division protein PerM n=1 Tax=Bifidobacterium margollesii TaxID=2020964 RepID=UPI00105522DC|nr:DUF6350 family protein [Bifidobacterium margollesii]
MSCYNALMLLLISMEEGGQGLTDFSMPLTKAVMLYSQGVGLQYPPLTLTVIPLGLTVLLIVLIRACSLRLGCSWQGYVGGLAAWLAVHAWIASTSSVGTLDSMGVIELKTSIVFSIGYLLAFLPETGLSGMRRDAVSRLDQSFRRTLRLGVIAFVLTIAFLVLVSLITVVSWAVLGWNDMIDMFPAIGMGHGSAVMTTIAYLIWLPNLMLWALSWVCGGAFSIGTSAVFSLWSGTGYDLPSVPLFALLPAPVDGEATRISLMLLPGVLTFIIGTWMMLSAKRFAVLRRDEDEDPTRLVSSRMLHRFAHPAIAFCAASVFIAIVIPLLMSLSNGSLGTGRLSHIGVDVAASTRAIARPCALGFLAAWMIPLIFVCGRCGIAALLSRRTGGNTDSVGNSSLRPAVDDMDNRDDIDHAAETDSSSAMNDPASEHNRIGASNDADLPSRSPRVPRTAQSSAPFTVDNRSLRTEKPKRARMVASGGSAENPTTKEDK